MLFLLMFPSIQICVGVEGWRGDMNVDIYLNRRVSFHKIKKVSRLLGHTNSILGSNYTWDCPGKLKTLSNYFTF